MLCYSCFKGVLNPFIYLCFVLCRIFTAITKSHPQRSEVIKSDLDKCLPTILDIQCAFVKIRQICVIGEPHCNFEH